MGRQVNGKVIGCMGHKLWGCMGAAECSDILARRLPSNSIRTCQLASFTNSIKYYSVRLLGPSPILMRAVPLFNTEKFTLQIGVRALLQSNVPRQMCLHKKEQK